MNIQTRKKDWLRGDWIQTFAGIAFHVGKPHIDDIVIEDIAHALSMQCRYNGHVKNFYSVAEHCVHVSRWVGKQIPDLALTALLHDASEAYLCDIPRPIKPMLGNYYELEAGIEKVVAEKFNLVFPYPEIIKEADNRILFDEREQLLGDPIQEWSFELEPLGITIQSMPPWRAEDTFRAEFEKLVR